MARNMYGATSADFTLTSGGRVVPGAELTLWTARTGGTQITDLLDVDSVACTTVTSAADGSVVYYGPDSDATAHWADSGQGSRVAIRPVDITGEPPNLTVGTVTTGTADVTISGTSPDYDIDFVLPPVGTNGVDTAAIQAGAVTTAKLADAAVATAKLTDGAVTAAKIANDTITAAQIAANAVGASELADNAVDTNAIADSAVTSAKIADGTIVNADINASAAIAATKISGGPVPAVPNPAQVTIADGGYINPLWMSRDGRTIYASHFAQLKTSTDGGVTWSAALGTFTPGVLEQVIELDNGEVLVATTHSGDGSGGKLYLSSGFRNNPTAATWTNVLTSSSTDAAISMWGLTAYGNIVTASEYGSKVVDNIARYAYLSTDAGATWAPVFDIGNTEGLHVHGIAYDPWWDALWVCTGDSPVNTDKIHVSFDRGANWTVVDNAGHQCTGILPMPNCVLFTTDCAPSGVFRVDRSKGKTGIAVELAYQLSADFAYCGARPFHAQYPGAPALLPFLTVGTGKACAVATYDGWNFSKIWEDTINVTNQGLQRLVGPSVDGLLLGTLNDSRQAASSRITMTMPPLGPTGALDATAASTVREFRNRITFSNAPATVPSHARYVAQVGTMSASREVTLPAASSVAPGTEITVGDESGTVTATNTLVLTRAGSDTINGASTHAIGAGYGFRRLVSNGTNAWSIVNDTVRTLVTHPNTSDVLVQSWDATQNRWQVAHYDSGWRELALGADAASGSAKIRRVGSRVTISCSVVPNAGSGYAMLTGALPTGFTISASETSSGFLVALATLSSDSVGVQRCTVSSSGITWVGAGTAYGGTRPTAAVIATFSFLTDAAVPGTLPGTLVAAAPYS